MQVILYDQLNPKKIPSFEKMKGFLEADDFRSADVKKVGDNLYRARLDRRNRLLFSIYRYQGQAYVLALECIEQHAYEKSRFLRRGVTIDEDKLPALDSLAQVEAEPLIYLNPKLSTFHLLDKVLSFDDDQQTVYALPPPFIVIGSAGSGKTALTLEKMKESIGDILYVTRSPYLVHNSRNLYYALNYENDEQEVSFLSFAEYLASLRVPEGREMSVREFEQWFARHRAASKLKDSYQLFEEFKGVMTGPSTDTPYLCREDYLNLGVRQSIFFEAERQQVYDLFLKYLDFMHENGFYDANILSHQYMSLVAPRYDFIAVDEVQDLTNIQLQLILRCLRHPQHFILCGDSNQIVHPSFFSWSKLKSFFYRQEGLDAPTELIRILSTNYRNSVDVTEVANRILKLKTARFGSIDRESNYLVRSNADKSGAVVLLADTESVTRELNEKTRQSTRFAVVVMHPDQKTAAKDRFQTPLIFSIQEAKGLEYENIILYQFISADEERFREISRGVNVEDLAGVALRYARVKDKSDKSLEIYKFHINALYVAMTRAVENVYLIEAKPKQRLFDLLGLKCWEGSLDLAEQGSSLEEWRQEARRLELQGKQEQAEEIRSQILKLKTVPWEVLKGEALSTIAQQALENGDKKARLLLFEYALVYQDRNRMNALAEAGFRPAKQPEKGIKQLNQKYFMPYELKNPTALLRLISQYGVDFRNPFNQTPLMIAARLGNNEQVDQLVEMEADTSLVNNAGFNTFQIVLEQACLDPNYAAKKLAGAYEKLEPLDMVIQVDGRLLKLDKRLMEFLMLNLMIAMFYARLGENAARHGGAFSSADFVEVLDHFPDSVLPERRKKRAYISSILSKNEVERDDKYNRKLFRRIKQGHYIINPKLAVWVENEWRNIYDLLPLDDLGYRRREFHGFYHFDFNQMLQDHLDRFRA
ncbi:MAG: UvrD-helicase domain-containing protein, partial [bacterium]|nr:UvrD-helicase domain-containing protein [bacterium]